MSCRAEMVNGPPAPSPSVSVRKPLPAPLIVTRSATVPAPPCPCTVTGPPPWVGGATPTTDTLRARVSIKACWPFNSNVPTFNVTDEAGPNPPVMPVMPAFPLGPAAPSTVRLGVVI